MVEKFKKNLTGLFMNYLNITIFLVICIFQIHISKIINNMVQKSEENPHSIIRNGFEKRLDSFLYKRPVHKK